MLPESNMSETTNMSETINIPEKIMTSKFEFVGPPGVGSGINLCIPRGRQIFTITTNNAVELRDFCNLYKDSVSEVSLIISTESTPK